MAAPPVKSQPLHNFSLSHLKWARKKSPSSSATSSSHNHRSRRRDSPDQGRHRVPDPESDHEVPPENHIQKPPTYSPRNHSVSAAMEREEEENREAKPWNLRRRKEVVKAASTCNKQETSCGEKKYKKSDSNCNKIKSQRLRGMLEGGHLNGGVEREGKRKVWISLSKEEIEEDVYAFTGGKPARRPRKWPRNVQKQLDVYIWSGLQLTHTGE